METIKPTEENTVEQPGSNAALDQIEAEALAMNAGQDAGQDAGSAQPGAGPDAAKHEPDLEPQIDLDKAYAMTNDLAASCCKIACKKAKFVFGKKPEGISDERWEEIKEMSVAVFDKPLFQEIVIPVLKKYNLTLYNIPVEVQLIGGIVYLVQQMRETLQNEIAKAHKEQNHSA